MTSTDSGAQVERTGLAWERTTLSGLACSLLIAKLVGTHWAGPGAAIAVLGLGTTAGVVVQARRRHQRTAAAFPRTQHLPDAKICAALVGLGLVTGLGALIYAVMVAVSAHRLG